jgi:hypothetical protein
VRDGPYWIIPVDPADTDAVGKVHAVDCVVEEEYDDDKDRYLVVLRFERFEKPE